MGQCKEIHRNRTPRRQEESCTPGCRYGRHRWRSVQVHGRPKLARVDQIVLDVDASVGGTLYVIANNKMPPLSSLTWRLFCWQRLLTFESSFIAYLNHGEQYLHEWRPYLIPLNNILVKMYERLERILQNLMVKFHGSAVDQFIIFGSLRVLPGLATVIFQAPTAVSPDNEI